jgi:argininosuccinate synthase
MELIKASIDFTQRHVTGAVEMQLYKGNVTVLGRSSPYSLYRYMMMITMMMMMMMMMIDTEASPYCYCTQK